jgi:pimeloyl-ACP methyl ester carboxylesterase
VSITPVVTVNRVDVGKITAGYGDVVVFPSTFYADGSLRGIINVHGYGSVATTGMTFPNIGVGNYPAVTSDLGDGSTPGTTNGWGNDTTLSAITDCFNYLTTTMRCKTDKVFLIGTSMGCQGALVWAYHNPTKVAAVFVQLFVVDLNGLAGNNNGQSLAASINAAYGGTYSPSATDPTYSPLTVAEARSPLAMVLNNPSAWDGVPILCWWGGADPIALPPSSLEFIAAAETAGLNITAVQDIGRTDAAATYTSGLATVLDPNIGSGDGGALVTSVVNPYTNIPYTVSSSASAAAYVLTSSIVPGVSFTMTNSSTGVGGSAVDAAATGTGVIIGGGTHATTVTDLTDGTAEVSPQTNNVLAFLAAYS